MCRHSFLVCECVEFFCSNSPIIQILNKGFFIDTISSFFVLTSVDISDKFLLWISPYSSRWIGSWKYWNPKNNIIFWHGFTNSIHHHFYCCNFTREFVFLDVWSISFAHIVCWNEVPYSWNKCIFLPQKVYGLLAWIDTPGLKNILSKYGNFFVFLIHGFSCKCPMMYEETASNNGDDT